MNELTTATLRNGAEVPEVAVASTMVALRRVLSDHPIAFYEAVEVARDPGHEPFGNAGQVLENFGLLGNGRMHEVVRDVILSAVEGDDFEMQLRSPVADEG